MKEEQGVTPPALVDRPELTVFQTWLVNEFGRLSRDRRYTESGPMPLHTGAIKQYYDAFSLEPLDFETFYDWMTRIDGIWLDQVAERRKKEQAAAKAKAKASRPNRH